MEQPIINWFIIEDDEQTQQEEYYLGSFNSNAEISLQLQIWNNRYGTKYAQSISNAKLVLFFETLEDSALLNYCTVNTEEGGDMKPNMELNKASIYIGELNGDPNNGVDSDKNKNHFKNVTITFKNFPSNLKEGLKNLFIDIQYN